MSFLMCGLLTFKNTLLIYSIFSSILTLSSFLWWICFFWCRGVSLDTVLPFSSLFTIFLRLSWDGCALAFFQHIYLLFKTLDFKLQVVILFTYSLITIFYNNLLNIGILALSTKSININIIASFTTIASGGFGSFGCAWRLWSACPKSIKLHFKIFMSLF
jgi:hypothetical protein